MAFDLMSIINNPQFQTGLGLMGAASPKNRPLLDAFTMMQAMQQRKMENEIKRVQLEAYQEQNAIARRNQEREAKMAEQFQQLAPQFLQQLGIGGQGQQAPAQIPQPTLGSERFNPALPYQMPETLEPVQPTGGLFNQADKFVADIEGGFVPNDAGKGPSNFGINQKANPDVNVRDLTPDSASQVRKQRYWDVIQADQIQQVYGNDAAMIAYDAAVNQGPQYATKLVEKAGGNPQLMMALRKQDYQNLAKSSPVYSTYLPGWENRLKKLEGQLGRAAQPTQIAQAQGITTQPQAAGLEPHRAARILGGLAAGTSGKYPEAYTSFAEALKPDVVSPGSIVRGPGGQITQMPESPLREREVKATERRVLQGEQEEARKERESTQKVTEAKVQDWRSLQATNTNLDMLDQKIRELANMPGTPRIFGLVGALPDMPGQPAADARTLHKSITSQLAKETLQAVRDASKTGGAFGNVSNYDIQLLETAIANLDSAQSYKSAVKAMEDVLKYTDKLRKTATSAYERTYKESPTSKSLPAGWKVEKVK